jgi:hypothetical protein
MTQHHSLVAQALSPSDVAGEGNQVGLFASVGSQSVGGAGRISLTHGFTASATIFETSATYDGHAYGQAILHSSITYGGSLRWLQPSGKIQPFAEVGGWIAPNADLEFRRAYANGSASAVGVSKPSGNLSYYYGRTGVVIKLRSIGRLTASGELGRELLRTGSYDEALSNADPFEAHYGLASDRLTVVKAQTAWTYDLTEKIGINLNGIYGHGFAHRSSLAVFVPGIGTLSPRGLRDATWIEYGGSVSFRFLPHASVALFASGITGNQEQVGTETHIGAAIRANF